MEKIITQHSSGKHSVSFRAGNPFQTAPKIVDTMQDDDGNDCYVLENGNIHPCDRYDAIWRPIKGIVKPEGTKAQAVTFLNRFAK